MTVLDGHGLPLLGGFMIGGAAALFWLADGRVAGISGIVAALPERRSPDWPVNMAFVAGLLLGAPLYRLAAGAWPASHVAASAPILVLAGLLVGFGTRLGSGCTSGHGVCGLARLSPRSAVAVATFMTAATITVFFVRHSLGAVS